MLSEGPETPELSASEEYVNSQTTKKTQATNKSTYRLQNVLRPGRTTQYTAKTLFDQIQEKDIKLDPDYQRDVVWSDAKQIGLIDSIFRNFYVPPIIFAVTTEDDGTEKRICIDGKQRLISIQKFIAGIIPYRDPFTKERLWFVDSNSGPKRKLLPPQYRTLFQNKQIVCIEYNDLPPDYERELFQRVQMGMALTTAEKLQAISGPWPNFVHDILKQYYAGEDGIASYMDLEKSRARDFQTLAQMLFCIDQLPNHVQGTTMQIERWLANQEGPSDVMQARIHGVFRIYKDLAKDQQLNAPFKKPNRVAPVEFIMVGILIAIHKENLSLPQLSKAIGILRIETCAAHMDIWANAKVFKTMFNVISTKIEASGKASEKRKHDEVSRDMEGVGGDEEGPRPKAPKIQAPTSLPPPSTGLPATQRESRPRMEPPASDPVPRSISTGPKGLARIHAAKAHAADISNEPSSRLPRSPTVPVSPYSLPSRHIPHTLPRPPHPEQIPQSVDSSLEAKMMGVSGHSTPPHAPRPLRPVPAQPTALKGSQKAFKPSIPISANISGSYRPSPTWTPYYSGGLMEKGHQRNESTQSSRDDPSDGYRVEHSRYSEQRSSDAGRELESWDRPRDNDHSPGIPYS